MNQPTERDDRVNFHPGEVVYWQGKKYRVFDYVKATNDRRWLRDNGGRLKIVDVSELQYGREGDE